MFIPFLPVKSEKHSGQMASNDISSNIYTSSGRQALTFALKSLDVPTEGNILAPSSLCNAVIEPLISHGINLNLYGLNKSLQWDIKEISSKINPQTIAIYVIHYFGISYDLNELRKLCDKHNILLIEDCALHGFDPSNNIGASGDFSIYSLWKFLPIPDGGLLRVNNEKLKLTTLELIKRNFKIDLKARIKISINSILFDMSLPLYKLKNIFLKNINDFEDYPQRKVLNDQEIYRISNRSKGIYFQNNLSYIRNKRLSNYSKLLQACKNLDIKTLFECVPDTSFPYAFPVYVNDPFGLKSFLLKRGIQTEISINKPPYVLII